MPFEAPVLFTNVKEDPRTAVMLDGENELSFIMIKLVGRLPPTGSEHPSHSLSQDTNSVDEIMSKRKPDSNLFFIKTFPFRNYKITKKAERDPVNSEEKGNKKAFLKRKALIFLGISF